MKKRFIIPLSLISALVVGGQINLWRDAQPVVADDASLYMDNPAVEQAEAAANTSHVAPTVAVAPTPAPAPKTYKYTAQEAKYQYSFFYNFGRNAGVGHHDTVYNTKRQLDNHGFPPVTGQFRSTVKKCYDNTGDAYCWDR